MRVLLVVGMLLLGGSSLAQNYLVQHYTIHDGLVNDEVFCFAQDTSGVMWIGTDNGLSSFDGESFRNYSQEDGLAGNSITSLLLDKNNNLWAGAYKQGVSIKVQEKSEAPWQKVRKYSAGVDLIQLGNQYWEVAGMTISVSDSSEKTHQITSRYYTTGAQFNMLRNPSRVNIELSPNKEKIWVGSYMGLASLDTDGEIKALLPVATKPRLISEIHHLPDGSSLLGGPGIIRRLKDGHITDIYDLGLEDTFTVHRILPVGNEVWIAAEGYGLLSLNLLSGKVTLQKELLNLDADVIHSLFLDRDGNIWVGTRGNGFYCLQSTLLSRYNTDKLLCEKQISELNIMPNGDLAILSPNGLLLRHSSGAFKQVICDPRMNNYGSLTTQEEPVILSAFHDTKATSVRILNSSAACALTNKHLVYSDFVRIPDDGLHRLYIAAFNDKTLIDKYEITTDLQDKKTQIRYIFQDSANHIWLGTRQDSLWRLKAPLPKAGTSNINAETVGYQANGIKRAIVDPDGTIWLCGGRTIWRKRNDEPTFHPFLEDGPYYQMEMQSNGTIWIAKRDGLISLTNNRSSYYALNGYLDIGEVNALAISDESNTLWMASRDGLFSVSLTKLQNRKLPLIRASVTSLTINQQDIGDENISPLAIGDVLQVELSTTSYYSGLTPIFQYRINGKDWIASESHTIVLPSTGSGLFFVEISAALPSGEWGETINIAYEVLPGFWQSPLVWVLLILSTALTAFSIARFQIAKVKKRDTQEREIQKKFHQLEQQAFSAMLNPHFVFNTINSIQKELLEEDPMLAHRHLSKFAKLIRKNMDLSTRSTISLEEELERLTLYLEMEKLRLGEKIETLIQIDPQIPLTEVEIPSMILQPYVENAIWHGILLTGKSGTVTVRVGLTPNSQILIEIEDDGIGIEIAKSRTKSEDHISMGMAITQSRIASFHDETSVVAEQINDEAGLSKGTLVKIVIPLKIQLG